MPEVEYLAALYETERFLALLTTRRQKDVCDITVTVPRLTTLDEPAREKMVI